ncbi:MAG: hypothetical protein KDA84_30280, partial [Planctomycetaceae bacterium]|nr:hypothetical protein [Planctomycetaceae bacterium]
MATPVSTSQPETPPTSSWRQSSKETEPIPTHDWQTDAPPLRRRYSVPKFFAVVFLLISLGLLGLYVITALEAPSKTPIVFIDGFSPGAMANRWADEDVQRFQMLDGQTAGVVRLMVRNRAASGGLVGLDDVIRRQRAQIAESRNL